MGNWFEDWFNTPYYHILYKNRDHNEAEQFIRNLLTKLHPSKNAHFLDLACGKGRHAILINQQGYTTTGLDLASNSIAAAKTFENDTLSFFVHDMRQVFGSNTYDFILNLFTSFGYFDNLKDNLKVLKNIHTALLPNGKVVLDFLNIEAIKNCFPYNETKEIEGIVFTIDKKIENGFIIKNIQVTDGEKQFHYYEKLQAIDLKTFQDLFIKANLHIVDLFGDYDLNSFDPEKSSRLILIAEKK